MLFLRVLFDFVDGPAQLVDFAAVSGRPAAPLDAVDGAELAPFAQKALVRFYFFDKLFVGDFGSFSRLYGPFVLFVRPFVPDADVVFDEVGDVRRAGKEPDQFVDDAAEKGFFGGEEREAAGEVEADLAAEDAFEFDAGGVAYLPGAVFQGVAEEVEVLMFGVEGFFAHD